MVEEKPLAFTLSVYAVKTPAGEWNLQMQTIRGGIPDEIIITVVRHRLRKTEEENYSSFSKNMYS